LTHEIFVSVDSTTHVPVGEDQRQHLELARELAHKMNRLVGTDFFPIPIAMISTSIRCWLLWWYWFSLDPAKRILALKGDQPKKMSKSAPDPRSRILITDSSKEIHDKIKTAFTDSIDPETLSEKDIPTLEQLSPGVANLYTILSCCTGEDPGTLIPRYYRKRYGHLKKDVAEAVDAKLTPIREEYERLIKLENQAWLRQVANLGRERAGAIAEANLSKIKGMLGIGKLWGMSIEKPQISYRKLIIFHASFLIEACR
jgi:tryptophanyl-tRNA synthetase